jgi:hypothetical protein
MLLPVFAIGRIADLLPRLEVSGGVLAAGLTRCIS